MISPFILNKCFVLLVYGSVHSIAGIFLKFSNLMKIILLMSFGIENNFRILYGNENDDDDEGVKNVDY